MLKISWPKELFKFCVYYSSVKWSHSGNFLKSQFVIFRCQKYVKEGTWKRQKKLP